MLLLENSKKWYFIQTDVDGIVVDANKHFKDSFEHICPLRVHDILHIKDIKVVEIAALRLQRQPHNSIKFIEARTIKSDGTYAWGLFEIMSFKNGYICIGIDLFPSFEDGSGRMKRQYDLLRKINFSLNHAIRKHIANIEGLINLSKLPDDKITRMLFKSVEGLNEEIKRLVNRFDNIKKL